MQFEHESGFPNLVKHVDPCSVNYNFKNHSWLKPNVKLNLLKENSNWEQKI